MAHEILCQPPTRRRLRPLPGLRLERTRATRQPRHPVTPVTPARLYLARSASRARLHPETEDPAPRACGRAVAQWRRCPVGPCSRTPLPCFRHDSDFRLLGSMKAPRLGDSVNASNRKLHLTEEHPCPTCRGGVFKRTVGVARASSLTAPAAAGSLGSLPTRTRR